MNRSKKELQEYYILIGNGRDKYDSENIHEGTIWILESKLTEKVLLVSKYEGEEVGILKQLDLHALQQINYDTAHLLIAVPPPLSNRLKVIGDKAWIQEGLKIGIGSRVEIFGFPGLPNAALGTVQFKGRLPGRNGISFGVELDPEHHGKGSTNGTFRYKKLFTCNEDCGVFLSIFKLRLARSDCDVKIKSVRPKTEGASNVITNGHIDLSNPETNLSLSTNDENSLQIDERIVWMSDFGPEFGTVKWCGSLPYSYDNRIIVGVEFDNAIGTGTGKYKGHQLFRAKRNHASLIPILGLLRAAVYMSMMSNDAERNVENVRSNLYKDFKFANNDEKAKNQDNNDSLDKLVDKVHKLTGQFSNDKVESNAAAAAPENSNGKIDYNGRGARPKTLHSDKEYKAAVSSFVKEENVHTNGFKIGDRVIISFGKYRSGVIRWIGKFLSSRNPDQVIAGIEMDEEDEKCYTAGMFQGEKIFNCPLRKGFFFPVEKCVHEND